MFTVIVPVVNPDLAENLFQSIEKNSIQPKETIIIDNSATGYARKGSIIIPGPLSVNASWNAGIKIATQPYVSILNDDLEVDTTFFASILKVFRAKTRCGVVCPYTVSSRRKLQPIMAPIYPMNIREGWAMTISHEALDLVPPIPADDLKTFCGDDWIWFWTRKAGYSWWKMYRTVAYHIGGVSINKLHNQTYRQEKKMFSKIIERYE